MDRYAPTLLDKLLGEAGDGDPALPRWTLERVRRSLARDIEQLLNTRNASSAPALANCPRAARSVVSLGMPDTGSACLASDHDRQRIAARIGQALAAHEPRLAGVEVRVQGRDRRALSFAIEARLRLHPVAEPVCFDAVLVPAAQRYAVAARDDRRG